MPVQSLPSNPSLENLRKQSKFLLKSVQSHNPDALLRVREFHPQPDNALLDFSLSDAQLVVARNYGFASWSRLKQHLDVLAQHSLMPKSLEDADDSEPLADRFIRLACLNYRDDHTHWRDQARKLLLEDPSLVSENIYTAVTVGDIATVAAMLKTNPRSAGLRGGPYRWEPLLYSIYSRLNSDAPGHSTFEVAHLLLAHGADPNAGYLWDGNYVFTALTGAFGEGERGPVHQPEHQYCYQLARMLLEAGADPNDSQTLYNRMFTGGTRHLELLYEFGLGKGGDGVWFKRFADMGTPAEMIQQQLAWAAKYNQLERLRLLVAHGAAVNEPDTRFQRTPYDLAVLHGNLEIAQYLLAHGARQILPSGRDAFFAACLSADGKRARSLLKQNPSLLQQLGDDRVELLQLAAESNKRDAIRLMATLNFDLNEIKRTTALHNAAGSGHLEMVRLLIELGADPLIRDTEFNARPIGWAQYGDRQDVVEYLKQFEPPEGE
jgi:ankyrin repeat protein